MWWGRGYGFGRGWGRGFGRGWGRGRGPGNPYPYCRAYPWLPRGWWWTGAAAADARTGAVPLPPEGWTPPAGWAPAPWWGRGAGPQGTPAGQETAGDGRQDTEETP